MTRFNMNIPEVLVAQARHILSDEQMAVIRGVARAQMKTGYRVLPDAIRSCCRDNDIHADPCLRALGWGPSDRDMIRGRITHAIEDMACTAGVAICEVAKVETEKNCDIGRARQRKI